MKKIAVLFSGGVESSVMLAKYLSEGWEVYPVYIEGGFTYEAEEKKWAQNVLNHYKLKYSTLNEIQFIRINWDYGRSDEIPKERKDIVIPLRNMILYSQAAIYMYNKDINFLASGILGDATIFPDTSIDYLNQLTKLIETGLGKPFELLMPFFNKEKGFAIRQYKDIVPFKLTKSCTTMIEDKHCGICTKCEERINGFLDAGVEDPTEYYHIIKKEIAA